MRGGSRPGAGRPRGAATKRTREIADRAVADGVLPLEYMLGVMRDPAAEPSRRDEMAKTAAPYLHPRLSAVAYSGPEGGPIEMRIEDKRTAALAILESSFDEVAPTGTGE